MISRLFGAPSLLVPSRPRRPTAQLAPAVPSVEMQRTMGNRATTRILCPSCAARALRVSDPGDALEREADRVADRVAHGDGSSRTPDVAPHAPTIQRCACGGTCDECRKNDADGQVHRSVETAPVGATHGLAPMAAEAVGRTIRAPGEPLDPTTRGFMEPRLGAALGGVRIHRDSAAAASARSVNAHAYTLGEHVVFGAGRYAPHTVSGKRLLAHELAHVLQQRGSTPQLIQRQGTAEHLPSLPYEKYGERSESAYRQAGRTREADAVRNCRVFGECSMLLTESEAYNAYRSGRISGGLGDPGPVAAAGALAARPLATGVGQTAARTAVQQAAVRWGTAAVIEGGGSAATTAVTGTGAVAGTGGAALATVAVPVAIGVYIAVAIADLISFGSFQAELTRRGYVILPSPLGVCIGLCHTGVAPARPAFPAPAGPGLLGPSLSRSDQELIQEWLRQAPVPLPRAQEEEERRRRCRLVRRTSSRGGDPLSDLYCSVVAWDAPSYDIYSDVGVAEIDALVGRTWYECKCGQLSLVRAMQRGERWARLRFESYPGLDEQIRRQNRIAGFCGYRYRLVVANEEVAAFFRSRYPDVSVVVFRWEPCE